MNFKKFIEWDNIGYIRSPYKVDTKNEKGWSLVGKSSNRRRVGLAKPDGTFRYITYWENEIESDKIIATITDRNHLEYILEHFNLIPINEEKWDEFFGWN